MKTSLTPDLDTVVTTTADAVFVTGMLTSPKDVEYVCAIPSIVTSSDATSANSLALMTMNESVWGSSTIGVDGSSTHRRI